jgi:hypothetical protein
MLTKARTLSKYYYELVGKIFPNLKFPSLTLYIPSEFISAPNYNHLKIALEQT